MAAASAQIGIRELTVITIPAAGSGHGTFFGTGGTAKSDSRTTGGTIDFGLFALAVAAAENAAVTATGAPVGGKKR
ncbi:MAG: hypothetical protein EBR86_13640 [Planctomycetia bacterium]|nr:hypothetical protein [Planctomycetia bacterium]